MLQYPTPSDQRYAAPCNPAVPVPQGSTYWAPGRPDAHHPAVNRDSDDRHGAPRLRSSSQLTSSNYPPATPNAVPSCDSYAAQSQGDCSGQRGYPSQQYSSGVNYASPPYDFAAYPIIPDSVYQGGQYGTQPPAPTRHEYPPSDPTSFQQTLYDPMAYFMPDGQSCSPLDSQHQQSLVSNTSGFLPYDDSFDRYDQFTQHPISPVPPTSSSSELGNALMEIPSPEHHHGPHSITLPTLPTQSHSAPKRDPSEGIVGIKSEYGTSGQPFSPMTPLDSHAPYPKEESQEQLHVGSSSMPRPPTPLQGHDHSRHGQQTPDSFRMVPDPAAYPEFAPAPKRHPPSLSIPAPLSYSPSARISTPRSSSFSSDTGTPTSAMHLLDPATSTSSASQSTMVPNPKAGQGVLKLPSTKRSARRKPAIACLFCRERKIACGAPPVGSADTTCNQCARRSRKCEYPTMSRRGLHKRRDNGGGHQRESEDADYVPTT